MLNDTKVIRARLETIDPNGKPRELLLLESHAASTDIHTHRALYRGKLHAGMQLQVHDQAIEIVALENEGIAVLKAGVNLI